MSRRMLAGPLVVVPFLTVTAFAQAPHAPATAADAQPQPIARLFPQAPVARRIDPIVAPIKRVLPVAAHRAPVKAALVAPKPIPAVRPAKAQGQAVATSAGPAAAVAAAPAPAAGTPTEAIAVASAVAAPAPQRIVAVTCRWGQDYSSKLKRCVASTSPLAAPPRGVAAVKAKAPAPSGVTVVNTPVVPGAVAAAVPAAARARIVGALSAARTKTANAKPQLDASTRMSLGVKKK